MEINDVLKEKKYTDAYSDDRLFDKILIFAKEFGIKLIYVALLLYFVLQKEDLPIKIKATIIGALGYFILPLDLINDLIPGIGQLDDMVALLFALGVAAFYVDQNVKNKAKAKLHDWFGAYDDEELHEIDAKIKKETTIK
jgi:uncharacterized membrane protein YkvA (DUF1232 family)